MSDHQFDNLFSKERCEKMSIPGSKHQRVIERATEVFCRYGFARTTMGDIAERCEISRPALYLLFPDKEAIFTAVVERMDQDKLASIRAEVAHLKDLRGKLLHACLSWGCHGVDLAAAHRTPRTCSICCIPSFSR